MDIRNPFNQHNHPHISLGFYQRRRANYKSHLTQRMAAASVCCNCSMERCNSCSSEQYDSTCGWLDRGKWVVSVSGWLGQFWDVYICIICKYAHVCRYINVNILNTLQVQAIHEVYPFWRGRYYLKAPQTINKELQIEKTCCKSNILSLNFKLLILKR